MSRLRSPLALLLAALGTGAASAAPVMDPPEESPEDPPAAPAPAPLTCEDGRVAASLTEGDIVGACGEDGFAFKGIPFAAPPVGALRLQDPRPPIPWDAPRDATAFGPACPQQALMVDDFQSEDCLTLNVWAPRAPSPLPVMVWLHGGAFFLGSGSEVTYEGARLAAAGDVVVVTVNYRLGALGFLAHEALSEGGTSGNYGIKDQVAALHWVQRNIAALGGDPDRVTIFGESAGGSSVCALMGAPAADGLYHRAIAESPVDCMAFATWDARSRMSAPVAENTARLLAHLGCEGGDDAEIRACLEAAPTEDFVSAFNALSMLIGPGKARRSPTVPFVDGVFIPQQPSARVASGAVDVPLIIGTTHDETRLFFAVTPVPTRLTFQRKVRKMAFHEASRAQIRDLYGFPGYKRGRGAFMAYTTDSLFSCPALAFAEAAAEGAPVYLYEWDWRTRPTRGMRAHHGVEMPFVFGNFGIMGIKATPENVAVSEAVMGQWARFAHGEAPTDWPAFTPGGQLRMLDDAPYLVDAAEHREGRCPALMGL